MEFVLVADAMKRVLGNGTPLGQCRTLSGNGQQNSRYALPHAMGQWCLAPLQRALGDGTELYTTTCRGARHVAHVHA